MLLSRPAQLTMTPRIMRVELKDRGRQGDEHRLEFQPDTNIPLFENFVATQPSEVLVSVFRQVLNVVHRKQLKDFHLKVQNGWRGSRWKVVLLHGNPDRVGPLVCSRCMSCDLACPLKLGITGHGEEGKLKLLQFLLTFSCKFAKLLALVGLCSADTLITNADGVRAHPELRCWLDAQGRDKLIVTPVKHLSSLSEMDDDLMADFWKVSTFLDCILPEHTMCYKCCARITAWHVEPSKSWCCL